MSLWSNIRETFSGVHNRDDDTYSSTVIALAHPLSVVRELIDSGLLRVARKPKDNVLDLSDRTLQRLYIFLSDHDYPDGSAAMHNAAFSAYGLPFRSCFMIGDPNHVEEIFALLRLDPVYAGGGAGSGFKEKIAPCLDKLTPSAETSGSVNAIAYEGNAVVGHNTDGIGFVTGLLSEYPDCIVDRKIVILGAGGAALPIAYELAKCTPKDIIICSRTVSSAERIARLIAPFASVSAVGVDMIGDALSGAELLINTSDAGARPNGKCSAFTPMTGNAESDIVVSLGNLAQLPSSAIVADILLEEMPPTLKLAAARGLRTFNGRHMTLYQAVSAFKIITGQDKPDDEILALTRAALRL